MSYVGVLAAGDNEFNSTYRTFNINVNQLLYNNVIIWKNDKKYRNKHLILTIKEFNEFTKMSEEEQDLYFELN